MEYYDRNFQKETKIKVEKELKSVLKVSSIIKDNK